VIGVKQLVLDEDKVMKLLCILENSLIHKDVKNKNKLAELQWDLRDELADFIGINLDEGTIDPDTFEYVKFKDEQNIIIF
jgi:hypothetical protein